MADESWDDIVAEAETSGFGEPAPLGTYEVKIISAEAGESSNKKTPQIKLKLKITKGPHAGKPATTYGHTFWKTQAAAWSVVGNCNAVGISNETLKAKKPTLAQIAAVMVDKVVNVTTVHEVDRATKEVKTSRDGSAVIVVKGTMQAKEGGAIPVTTFPAVAANVTAGYGAPTTPTVPTVPTAPAPF